jgi:predicted nuclease with RNAse H fold
MPRGRAWRVLGVDLAGSPKRPTGVCMLTGMRATIATVFSDGEILDLIRAHRPDLVPTDAPMSLPPGRRTVHDRNGAHFRPCDLELRAEGIRFFPVTLGPMRMLTERGLRLRRLVLKLGIRAVECYPGGAQDVWGIPRKQQGLSKLRAGLSAMGVRGIPADANDHELDAVTAALTGRQYLLGRGVIYGGEKGILMPGRRR